MKGSALASLKFSGVPGKFLICACFPSQGSFHTFMGGEQWSLQVPVCRHLQGAGPDPSGQLCSTNPLGHLCLLGQGIAEEMAPNEALWAWLGGKKAVPSSGASCDPTCRTGGVFPPGRAVPRSPGLHPASRGSAGRAGECMAGESFVYLVGRLNRHIPEPGILP